jgi:hypothetical protein
MCDTRTIASASPAMASYKQHSDARQQQQQQLLSGEHNSFSYTRIVAVQAA